MEGLRQSIKQYLIERRDKVLNGGINCIPAPFPRLREEFPGIEQGKYFVVTGATKSSKTQITNYLFIYNTVLYCYHNPGVIRTKIFFFPLEETKEAITLRFSAFLLNYITNGKVVISPTDLQSTDERKPIPQEVLDLMDSEEYIKIFNVYEEIVEFYEDRNPTGIYKTMKNYANTHGSIQLRKQKFEELDELGNKRTYEKEVFDKYIADDPDEYVIIVVDHVGLLTVEKELGTLKATIEKLSEYAIILRNRYHYTYVGVQQQNTETTNLDAFKANKIRPTKDGLKDSKRPGEDCDVLIGMTCPNAFEVPDYLKYDITKLRDNLKVFEVVLNRGGRANILCPLFHNGAINYYKELPLPTDTASMSKVYTFIQSLRNSIQQPAETHTFFSWVHKLIK